jgi:hypothetical protein
MVDDLAVRFLASLLRKLLTIAGTWLVTHGWSDDTLVGEVIAGLSMVLAATLWSFWDLHRAALFARLLVVLGLEAPPTTPPAVIVAEAHRALRKESHVFPPVQ